MVRRALAEDVGPGDATTAALGLADKPARAGIVVKEAGIICGLDVAAEVFAALGGSGKFDKKTDDGAQAKPGEVAAKLEGFAGPLLAGERTALNFLQRLSGIATLTANFFEAVGPDGPAIMDTRKTAPGLRGLEKYAVRSGGGVNHRMGLYDAILIKDSHKRLVGGAGEAVALARSNNPDKLQIVCEAETVDEAVAAEEAGADVVMFDNFTPEQIKEALGKMAGKALTEVSGGVTLENVAGFAALGVDRISVGVLTHSARALDVSMEIIV
ncbi:MAG: carboxylating nicotinate-nucleotide diphosphorylase [Candidatus Coatesbacteria bacterium]|nr:MAG: carboxylating nicotinate-nucleotide diphosphorylase [Candidatus Coatesbacteria bacterium]